MNQIIYISGFRNMDDFENVRLIGFLWLNQEFQYLNNPLEVFSKYIYF